jgi:hypothetical protein
VDARGRVAELAWRELIADSGTAVGLVASNETVGRGVDGLGAAVTPGADALAEEEETGPAGGAEGAETGGATGGLAGGACRA